MFRKNDAEQQQQTKTGGKTADDAGTRLENTEEIDEPRSLVMKALEERAAATFTGTDTRNDFVGKVIKKPGRRDFMPLEFQELFQFVKILSALVHTFK